MSTGCLSFDLAFRCQIIAVDLRQNMKQALIKWWNFTLRDVFIVYAVIIDDFDDTIVDDFDEMLNTNEGGVV